MRERARPQGRPCLGINRATRAFTLVELLVVISIIALLIGILLPVLGAARTTACQAQNLNGVRQLMAAHTLYQHDYDGHVIWGMAPFGLVDGKPVPAQDDNGNNVGSLIGGRYPWRLIDYMQDVWDAVYLHAETPPRPLAGDSAGDLFNKHYNLSLTPTFGINSIYVGGHQGDVFLGFSATTGPGLNFTPNRGGFIVFYDREVLNPSELIVFAETKARDVASVPPFEVTDDDGYFYVQPPVANGRRWRAEGNELVKTTQTGGGVPLSHCGEGGAATAFFDGHGELLKPSSLDDMRLWANAVSEIDYDPFNP